MVKSKTKEDLEALSEDELETLVALIRLDLAGDGYNLPPLDCGTCTGEKGCC